ncbi:MAG: glycosyltransferase family 4 protein [Vicinamibacterales bacterium]
MVIQRFRPYFSGQGVQVEELCRAFARRGRTSSIVTAVRGRPSEVEQCDGYDVRRLRVDLIPGSATRTSLWAPTFGARVFQELMQMKRPDAVHVHGVHDGLYGAAAFCRLRGVPLVFEMTLMGVDDPHTALDTRHRLAALRRRAYLGADAYVAMSRAFLPSYAEAGMDRNLLTVVPQGVDTARFTPLPAAVRAEVRTELGCAHDAPVVAFLGSLIERKGLDLLLGAWETVHAVLPRARLLLIGHASFDDGSLEREFLDRCVADLSVDAAATVLPIGLRDNPERYLGAADIFALPSRREGFGTAIIEAMACGLAPIVARLDGITDYIFGAPVRPQTPAAGDGIVVPQEDPQALAAAVIALLSDRARAVEIGRIARERVLEQFDLHRVVAPAYDAVYAAALEHRR